MAKKKTLKARAAAASAKRPGLAKAAKIAFKTTPIGAGLAVGKKLVKTKVGAKVAAKVKAAPKKVLKGAAKLGFKALLPVKPLLKNAVKRKGAAPENNIDKLALQFYRLVLGKSVSSFEYTGSEHLDPVSVSIVVKAVLDWIKKIQAKKKAGQPLTSEEAAAAKEIELSADAADKIKEEVTTGETPMPGAPSEEPGAAKMIVGTDGSIGTDPDPSQTGEPGEGREIQAGEGKGPDLKKIGIIVLVLVAIGYLLTRKKS